MSTLFNGPGQSNRTVKHNLQSRRRSMILRRYATLQGTGTRFQSPNVGAHRMRSSTLAPYINNLADSKTRQRQCCWAQAAVRKGWEKTETAPRSFPGTSTLVWHYCRATQEDCGDIGRPYDAPLAAPSISGQVCFSRLRLRLQGRPGWTTKLSMRSCPRAGK